MNTQIERDNWSAVRTELERRLPGWKLPPTVQSLAFVTATDLTQSSATLAKQDSASLSTLDSSSLRAASGPPTVRTYWWGFELTLSSQSLRDFLNVANPVNAIAAAIGPFMGPAAPYISLIAPFVAGALEQLSGLDRGAGVCIAMSWFAPGVFVPSTVPPGRGFGDVSREPRGLGEPKDQAGLPIILAVGFNMFGVRRDEDILWNLPAGTVREKVIVNLNPPGFGNIYFAHWLSDDPTVGHFRLHVGVEPFRGGVIEMRMMIRDVYGRGVDAEASTSDQPPARTGEGLACSVISSAPINPTDGARA